MQRLTARDTGLVIARTDAEFSFRALMRDGPVPNVISCTFSYETKPEVAFRHRSKPKLLRGHVFSTYPGEECFGGGGGHSSRIMQGL